MCVSALALTGSPVVVLTTQYIVLFIARASLLSFCKSVLAAKSWFCIALPRVRLFLGSGPPRSRLGSSCTFRITRQRASPILFSRFLGSRPPWSCPISTHPRGILRQASHGGAARGLFECPSKGPRRQDRPTLLRARYILLSSHPRRSIHHMGSNGNQSARQWFGLCKGKESGRPSLRLVFYSTTEP